jgi:hypothetical protein
VPLLSPLPSQLNGRCGWCQEQGTNHLTSERARVVCLLASGIVFGYYFHQN